MFLFGSYVTFADLTTDFEVTVQLTLSASDAGVTPREVMFTDPEDTSFSDDQIVTYIVPEPDTPDAEPQAEAADEGVQFEALALQQLGRRN